MKLKLPLITVISLIVFDFTAKLTEKMDRRLQIVNIKFEIVKFQSEIGVYSSYHDAYIM